MRLLVDGLRRRHCLDGLDAGLAAVLMVGAAGASAGAGDGAGWGGGSADREDAGAWHDHRSGWRVDSGGDGYADAGRAGVRRSRAATERIA